VQFLGANVIVGPCKLDCDPIETEGGRFSGLKRGIACWWYQAKANCLVLAPLRRDNVYLRNQQGGLFNEALSLFWTILSVSSFVIAPHIVLSRSTIGETISTWHSLAQEPVLFNCSRQRKIGRRVAWSSSTRALRAWRRSGSAAVWTGALSQRFQF